MSGVSLEFLEDRFPTARICNCANCNKLLLGTNHGCEGIDRYIKAFVVGRKGGRPYCVDCYHEARGKVSCRR